MNTACKHKFAFKGGINANRWKHRTRRSYFAACVVFIGKTDRRVGAAQGNILNHVAVYKWRCAATYTT
jgi:hypothetical protein